MSEQLPRHNDGNQVPPSSPEAVYAALSEVFQLSDFPTDYRAILTVAISHDRTDILQRSKALGINDLLVQSHRQRKGLDPNRPWLIGLSHIPSLGQLSVSALTMPLKSAHNDESLLIRRHDTADYFVPSLAKKGQPPTFLPTVPFIGVSRVGVILEQLGYPLLSTSSPEEFRTAVAQATSHASGFLLRESVDMPVDPSRDLLVERTTLRQADETSASSTSLVQSRVRSRRRGKQATQPNGGNYETELTATVSQYAAETEESKRRLPMTRQIIRFIGSNYTIEPAPVRLVVAEFADNEPDTQPLEPPRQFELPMSPELLGIIHQSIRRYLSDPRTS